MSNYPDFEKSVADLEGRIKELKLLRDHDPSLDLGDEIRRLEDKAAASLRDIYAGLTPWQKCRVARHPDRPHFIDYAASMDSFLPLCGDRTFGEDAALMGGLALDDGRRFMLLGHERGRDLHGRLKHNFGMGRPEGYRKAVRLMEMAERFALPVVTLIDTPGAYPGVGAEERGQAEAIARATQKCLSLGVPLVAVIIGEGGSGGAVSLAAADMVMMPEHAVYSVISPEGCASILWRDAAKADDAAAALCLTADKLSALKVVDKVISEPVGGGHRNPSVMIASVKRAIYDALDGLTGMPPETLRTRRRDKFLSYGNA